jgi:YVTN family beta-propeller protein
MAGALAVDVRRGHLFVADEYDRSVSMLDARTARLLRTVFVDFAPVALAVDAPADRVFVLQAITQQGNVSGRSRLSVLDARSGALLRTVTIGSARSSLAVDERAGRVFVANADDGRVSVLDAHDGTLRRTVTVGPQPTTLAVDERRGRVYVVNAGDGTLSLLDARSGTLLHTVHVDPTPSLDYPLPDALAVDAARDHDVLDARTGALRQRITVGVAPQAVAVEEGSGCVVVVNRGDAVVHPADDWLAQGVRRLRMWLPWPWLGWIAPRLPDVSRVPGSMDVINVET